MHWPFLAPTVRVSFGGKTAQIGALNCFNAILQACTPPHCFSASSHVVQSRPALAAYHAPDLLGGGSCTSRNPPCQVEPTEVGKLSRESSPESRPRLLSTLLHDAKGKSAGARQRASNKRDKGQRAKKKSVMIIRLSNGEYPFISPSTHRDSAALLAVAPLQGPGTYCTVYLPT